MKKEIAHQSDGRSGDDDNGIANLGAGSSNADANLPEPSNPGMATGTDHIDLLQNGRGDSPTGINASLAAPDVLVTGNGMSSGHSGSIDLIDFGCEITPASDNQWQGNRDSAISTGSSARMSSFSSNRSSGVEFPRDSSIHPIDRSHGDITEEDSGFDFTGLEHLDIPDANFRKRTSEITDEEKRKSTLSHRGSTSSGTITGAQGEGSNRDSQASILSFDVEFPPRSGSSSTADDEREANLAERKPSRASSRAASLKRRLGRTGSKSKGKGSFHGDDDFNERTDKKDKGFFNRIRKGRQKDKTSKASGARVYEKLAEKTLDTFDITNRLPHPEVEVKTTKGL